MNPQETLANIERFIKNADAEEVLLFIEKLATERPDVYAALMKKLTPPSQH